MSSNKKLPRDYVERKTHPLMEIKKEWKVHGRGQYYYLDLKMSQIKELDFDSINLYIINKKDILPLTSSLRLQILNASNNKIAELDTAGNPIDRDPSYQTEILRNTNIM
ncbi:hypothetical protein KUTeg_015864 [Tegillarca granosa]|uniref:Uncharacterized protein n=1 Tax=Tegillarca granosa TaxID=220873 RepID=A0ABQ9EJ68_TEGGR|nr:hypothetical protein KUTeg_015864 [Tegillarca granosa]